MVTIFRGEGGAQGGGLTKEHGGGDSEEGGQDPRAPGTWSCWSWGRGVQFWSRRPALLRAPGWCCCCLSRATPRSQGHGGHPAHVLMQPLTEGPECWVPGAGTQCRAKRACSCPVELTCRREHGQVQTTDVCCFLFYFQLIEGRLRSTEGEGGVFPILKTRKLGFREVSHLPDDRDSEWQSRTQRAQRDPEPAGSPRPHGGSLRVPAPLSREVQWELPPEGAGEGHVPSLGKRQ